MGKTIRLTMETMLLLEAVQINEYENNTPVYAENVFRDVLWAIFNDDLEGLSNSNQLIAEKIIEDNRATEAIDGQV